LQSIRGKEETMHTFAQKQNPPQQTPKLNRTRTSSAVSLTKQVHPILPLQRTIGNQAVLRLLQAKTGELEADSAAPTLSRTAHDFRQTQLHAEPHAKIQRSLAVSTQGDVHEREAHQVAEHVMRTPGLQLQPACACGGECPKCQQKQPAQGPVHLKPMHDGTNDQGQTAVPSIIHETLRSPGQPLDTTTRAFFEPRLGSDFSRVRIHADDQAAQSTKAINARAYTLGNEIAFGSGEYRPTTAQGRGLLAHELAHVVQQNTVIHRQQGQEDFTSTQQPATDGQLAMESTASGDQCQDCLNACEVGGEVFLAFCRSLTDPALRAGCFALTFAGTVACKGWCYWHFCD
jgi:hypothetical protein